MKDWKFSTVGEQCTVIAGQSPKGKYYNTEKVGLPFYQGKKEFGDKYIGTPVKWTSQTTREALNGDILMSVRAPVGPINYSTQKICIGRGLASIRSGKSLNKEFLYYYLLSKQDDIKGHEGAVFASINKKQIESIVIPLPPLPEQQRIVSILDEVFEGIGKVVANVERNIENSRELFKSYLERIFKDKGEGWISSPLGDLCHVKHGFAFKSKYFTTYGDYIVLTPGSFYESGGFRDQGQKTKYYIGDIPDVFKLNKDDFLFAMTEQAVGLLGSSLSVPERNRYLHNQRLGLVQVHNGVTWENDFFQHQFNTKHFRDAVQETASGVKVRHTSPKKLQAITVQYPTKLSEQKKIASHLNEVRAKSQALKTIYEKKLISLEELKQSVLQKAFTGELTAKTVDKIMEPVPA